MKSAPIACMLVAMAFALAAPTSPPAAADMLNLPDQQLAAYGAEWKIVGPAPLPVRVARENWDEIRARVDNDPILRRWTAARANVTRTTMQWNDKVQYIAGWGHDLVDPSNGRPIAWRNDMPEPDSTNPANAKLHGAWVAINRSRSIAAVQEAARLYRLTGDRAMADWAASRLDFYAENYTRWPVQTRQGQSRMMGQSLDEATVVFQLVDAARLLKDEVDGTRWAKWNQGLFRPLFTMLSEPDSKSSGRNIAVWQAAARAAIALHLGQKDAFDAAMLGQGGVYSLLSGGVTEDFLWYEPSLSYNGYTVRALASLFEAASLRGMFGSVERAALVAQNMLLAPTTFAYSDLTMPVVGDSAPGASTWDYSLLPLTQRSMPIRVGKMPISWDTIIDPVSVQVRDQPPLRQGLSVEKGWQIAMLRKGGWEVFITYGQPNQSHAQRNALSYQLRYRGARVSEPAGLVAYGSNLFLDYIRQSVGHNMPLIDSQGHKWPGPGVLEASGDSGLTARFAPLGPKGSAERAFAVGADGAFTETTAIDGGGGDHRLGVLFHSGCALSSSTPTSPTGAPQGADFAFFSNIQVTAAVQKWSAKLQCGDQSVTLSIAAGQAGRVYIMDDPDVPGRPHSRSVYFEVTAPSSRFTTRIVPAGAAR